MQRLAFATTRAPGSLLRPQQVFSRRTVSHRPQPRRLGALAPAMVAPALLFLLLGASLAVIVAWLDAGAGAPSLITGRWLHGTKWGLPASIHAGCCLT